MDESHREKVFGDQVKSGFIWCLHCERTYESGKSRVIDGMQMCPYADCSGDAVIDAWDWSTMRDNHPEYPEVPEFGKVYPAYPDTKN